MDISHPSGIFKRALDKRKNKTGKTQIKIPSFKLKINNFFNSKYYKTIKNKLQ